MILILLKIIIKDLFQQNLIKILMLIIFFINQTNQNNKANLLT